MDSRTLQYISHFYDISIADAKHKLLEDLMTSMRSFVSEALNWQRRVLGFDKEHKILCENRQACFCSDASNDIGSKVLILKGENLNSASSRGQPENKKCKKTIAENGKGVLRSSEEIGEILILELAKLNICYIRSRIGKLSALILKLNHIVSENNSQSLYIAKRLQQIEASQNVTASKNEKLNSYALRDYSLSKAHHNESILKTHFSNQDEYLRNSVITFYFYEEDNILRDKHGKPVLGDDKKQVFLDTHFKNYISQTSI